MDVYDPATLALGSLPLTSIVFLDSTLCTHRLPASVARTIQLLIIRRGGCSFSDKLANIPSYAPGSEALQLVVILNTPDAVSDEERTKQRQHGRENELIRPLLDKVQKTPHGFERRHGVAMCLVDGSDEVVEAFRNAATIQAEFDDNGHWVEMIIVANGGDRGSGVGVKRRWWFESMGMPIGNLLMV